MLSFGRAIALAFVVFLGIPVFAQKETASTRSASESEGLGARVENLQTGVRGIALSGLCDILSCPRQEIGRDSGGTMESTDPVKEPFGGPRFHANFFDIDRFHIVVADDGRSFTINLNGRGVVIAYHRFEIAENLGRIVDFHFDLDFVLLLTDRGRLLSLPWVLAHQGLFNTALPLVHHLTLPDGFGTEPNQNPSRTGALSLFEVSRARKRPENLVRSADYFAPADALAGSGEPLPPQYVLRGGDFFFFRGTSLLGHISRELLISQMALAVDLALLGRRSGTPLRVLQMTRAALATLEGREQDVFTWEEWPSGFETLARRAEALAQERSQATGFFRAAVAALAEPPTLRQTHLPAGDSLGAAVNEGDLRAMAPSVLEVPQTNRSLPRWFMRPRNLAMVGMGLVTSMLGVESVNWGIDQELIPSLRPFFQALAEMIPEVLVRNPAEWAEQLPYRFYLIPSFLFLAQGVPLMQALSTWVARLKGGQEKGYNFIDGFGEISKTVYSWLTKMLYIRAMEKLPRGAAFFLVTGEGQNPFRKIAVDSPLGKKFKLGETIHLGWLSEAEAGSPEARAEALTLRRKILGALEQVEQRKLFLAFVFALSDLATERGCSRAEILKALSQDAPLDNEVKAKAANYWNGLDEMGDRADLVNDLDVGSQKFESLRTNAHGSFEIRKTENRLRNPLEASRPETLARFLSTWGAETAEILRHNRISRSVAEETWANFRSDYWFSILVTSLFGGRADLENPAQLAADPNRPDLGFTGLFNTSDSGEQLGAWGWTQGAIAYLQWLESEIPSESRNLPWELKQIETRRVSRGFWADSLAWLQNLFSVPASRTMAKQVLRGGRNTVVTVQPTTAVGGFFRMVVGGQSLPEALMGNTFVLGSAYPVRLTWSAINFGNFTLKSERGEMREAYRLALTHLSQALRTGGLEAQMHAVAELQSLYLVVPEAVKEAVSGLAPHGFSEPLATDIFFQRLGAHLDKVEELLLLIAEARARGAGEEDIRPAFAPNFSANSESLRAIHSQWRSIVAAVTQMEPLPFEGLTPVQFFEWAKENPPFPTDHHWLVTESSSWALASFPTTVYLTILAAISYGPMTMEKVLWSVGLAPIGIGALYGIFQHGIPWIAERLSEIREKRLKLRWGEGRSIYGLAEAAANADRRVRPFSRLHGCAASVRDLAQEGFARGMK